MILIVSNIANEAATRLVDMFPPGAASLITASSFHKTFSGGFITDDFASSRININGAALSTADITGVVTTISSFIPDEFYYIDPADQQYVCAEMNAFFTWFLSTLNCKKINPTSVRSFCSGNLLKIEWIKMVSATDIPIWPVTLVNSKNAAAGDKPGSGFVACSVIGDKIIGTEPPAPLTDYLVKLQGIFEVAFLTGYFILGVYGKYYLADISMKPDITSEANCEAIVNYFS